MNEEKAKDLIKAYCVEVTDEEVDELEKEGFEVSTFDISIDGLAMYFDGIEDEALDGYFEIRFSTYSEDFIGKSESGYYVVSAI